VSDDSFAGEAATRLRVDDNATIENANRITVEASVNTPS
jgi:hypothetical protein